MRRGMPPVIDEVLDSGGRLTVIEKLQHRVLTEICLGLAIVIVALIIEARACGPERAHFAPGQ